MRLRMVLDAFAAHAHGAYVGILTGITMIGIGQYIMHGDKWLAEVAFTNLLLSMNLRGGGGK